MYCDQIPETVNEQIQKIYDKMKDTEEVHTFYLDFLKKQLYPFFKEREKYIIKKEILSYAVERFIKKMIEKKEIFTFYNIQCISCHKKVYGPVLSLSDVPSLLKCPYCNESFDFNESYMVYDLRFIFAENVTEHIS